MKRYCPLSPFSRMGPVLASALLVVCPALAREPWEWNEEFYRSAQFAEDTAFFFQMERQIRQGDESWRAPLLELVMDGGSSHTVFAALLLLRNDLVTIRDLNAYKNHIRRAARLRAST